VPKKRKEHQTDLRTTIVIGAALVISVFVVYAQCINHSFIRLDDPDYVIENDHVNSGLSLTNIKWAFTAMYASNWHPLTWISHMIDVQLFGLDAGKHILVNVTLHAINSLLLFLLLRRATNTLWPSAAVAAFFALHPLHVESVAWVSERKDVLSTLFFLLTLFLWTQFVQSGERSRYWWAVAAFAAGLMSKPMLVTTPFVLLLLDWWPYQRAAGSGQRAGLMIEKWPFFALSLVSSLITLRAQRPAMGASPFGARLENAIVSYIAYLQKTVWPADLSIVYPFRTPISPAHVAIAAALFIAITAIVIFYRHRFPFLLVGWFWYVGTLVPVIGIVQVGHEAMADRYTYIPLIGIFIALAWMIMRSTALRALSTAAMVALAVVAFRQARYWRSGVELFEHALAVSGSDRHVHEGLGTELLKARQYQQAQIEFRAALTEAPKDDALHTGLGSALMQSGDIAGARREFEVAIATNPRNATALRRLGDLEMASGRTDLALKLFDRSVAAKNDPSTVALVTALRGNVNGAVTLYRQAIAREPDRPEIRSDLAALLSRSGRDREAVPEYQETLRIDPNQYEARMNFGAVLTRLGRNDEAIMQFTRAAELRPESAEPHVYLALVYSQMKRDMDALREAMMANQIDPASANLEFSNAIRMPYGDTNLTGWIGYLRTKAIGAQGRN
jgi:protein O-mannosyl-transferase